MEAHYRRKNLLEIAEKGWISALWVRGHLVSLLQPSLCNFAAPDDLSIDFSAWKAKPLQGYTQLHVVQRVVQSSHCRAALLIADHLPLCWHSYILFAEQSRPSPCWPNQPTPLLRSGLDRTFCNEVWTPAKFVFSWVLSISQRYHIEFPHILQSFLIVSNSLYLNFA